MRRIPLVTLLLGLLAPSLSCGPREAATASAHVGAPAAVDPIERRERLVSEAIARARESAVALEYSAAGGSARARRVATGVVVSRDGDVLSIRIDRPPPSSPIVARDASGRRLPVRWVAADRDTGLTLLRIEGSPARPSEASTRPARLGGEVLIIGNPFGLGHSVTRGSIAGLDRRLELGHGPLGGLIQVDAPLHPGDSGALVADLRGAWLGLIRSGLAAPDAERSHDNDLGFAIPAQDALWVAGQLRTRGRVDRAYLGVRLDPGRAGDPPGALLDDVLEGTPAARAGLRAGDRVIALDGHAVRTARELTDRLDRTPADAETTVEYLRLDHRERLTLHTARRPRREPTPTPTPAETTKSDTPLPREVQKRIERLERRIEELEKGRREQTAQRP